jgi:hypothetical protein
MIAGHRAVRRAAAAAVAARISTTKSRSRAY